MNDSDIIKALECCSVHPMKCRKCPYQGIECCTNAHRKDALDLIERQKAEIVNLQKRIIFWRDDLNYDPRKERNEAIGDFAKKTHEKITEIYNKHIFDYDLSDTEKEAIMDFSADVESGIDSLVEEMTEREHETKKIY